ncbi:MAG TPA: arsenate reductase ArsC [Candidatus Limnocylindria bacterium]|jgi:arsenate reductase|nr:arsenate reductase ArsC [Candidatus Limnocylindria bacterium]
MTKRRVLFVCVHNSARSQMAEGMLRAWAGDRFEVASGGTEARGVRPEAIEVMGELGIDISSHASKTIEQFMGQPWDFLIPVCEEACEACPYVPGAKKVLRWSFDDPSAATGSEAERRAEFRRVRDELATEVRAFISAT